MSLFCRHKNRLGPFWKESAAYYTCADCTKEIPAPVWSDIHPEGQWKPKAKQLTTGIDRAFMRWEIEQTSRRRHG